MINRIKPIHISNRLAEVAKLVKGPKVADVGCDGANLAIWLAQNRNFFVYASDLRAGPLEKAQLNVEKFNIAHKIKLIQAYGLQKIPSFVNDIIIAGLGGEQICNIVLSCSWTKTTRTRLILQPQSFSVCLKQRLCSAGFALEDEVYVIDKGKAYLILVARFCGVSKELSLSEALTSGLKFSDEAAKAWVAQKKQKFLKALNCLQSARPTAAVLRKKKQFEQTYSILNRLW